MTTTKQTKLEKLESYRAYLRIDPEDLDECIIEQPELMDHVGTQHVLAIAAYDTTELLLEEARAEEDAKLREAMFKIDEKITEARIKQMLAAIPRIRELQRELIVKKTEVGQWGALKEAYIQRSKMLRELVTRYVSRVMSSSSIGQAKQQMFDASKELVARQSERLRSRER